MKRTGQRAYVKTDETDGGVFFDPIRLKTLGDLLRKAKAHLEECGAGAEEGGDTEPA